MNAASSIVSESLRPPFRVHVLNLIDSRYGAGSASRAPQRPESWDERIAGVDLISGVPEKNEGSPVEFKLQSTGGQSPPQPGWVILVSGGSATEGWEWTLYGLPR